MSSDIAFLPPATPQKAIALSIISNWYCIYRRQHRVDRHQHRIYRRQNRFDRHQYRIYRRQNRFDRHQHRFIVVKIVLIVINIVFIVVKIVLIVINIVLTSFSGLTQLTMNAIALIPIFNSPLPLLNNRITGKNLSKSPFLRGI
ncbi:hypothetical protein H6G64_28305 [Calothrix sp. FACHB-156]|nr:hypothetical protein [Calothrix sp. FACHB-156]